MDTASSSRIDKTRVGNWCAKFNRRSNQSSRSFPIARFPLGYCLLARGLNTQRPILPNPSEVENPSSPLTMAEKAGAISARSITDPIKSPKMMDLF